MRDISEWLDDLGLAKYAEAFMENEIDLDALPHITEADLKEIGVALGARRKLLTAIDALDAGASPAVPVMSAAEGGRRQVTVLFADLSGFTTLSNALDAEETHALLNRFFTVADGVVKAYGGNIDKHIGDAVMAVFGAPVAHTNDSERAIRAALDIHAGVAGLDPPLAVHIGVASGQVVASGTGSDSHREYTVTGNSVNLASRLTEMAETGEILVSDAVRAALGHQLEAEALGETAIQGLARPVPVWRVGALRADAAGSRHPFVGRAAELAQIGAMIETTTANGNGVSIYVRGEAGIGKTRLVEEFQRLAEARGYETHTGLVLDFGVGKGQDAIRSLVRSLLGIRPGGGKAVRAEAARQAVASRLIDATQLIHLNDLLDLEHAPELRSLYDAMDNQARNRGKEATLAALVRSLSAERPSLLRVEDLHWADGIVLAHLANLAATVAECPALLVMTSRVEGDPLDQAWRVTTQGAPIVTIDLGPLRAAEAAELAGDFLEVSGQFARNCIERAGGNPLFLEQLLRSAEESSQDAIPGSVQSIVQARMDNLEPQDREALQVAAVLGQRFSLPVLRHVIENPNYTPNGLILHFLVRPVGDDFLFAHALIREGAYGSLLKSRQRELHHRAAAWFADRDRAVRAEHLERAEDPTAPRAYLEAARAEATEYRNERARDLLERGLALADDAGDRFTLGCFHGDLLRGLGAVEESIQAFEAAVAVAEDDVARCRAWTGMAAGMRILNRHQDALRLLDRAEAVAAAHDLVADLAQIRYHRGSIFFLNGDIDGCLAQHDQARQHARQAGSPEDEARALSGLGDAVYMRGRMRTAHEHYVCCVDLAQRHGFGGIETANVPAREMTRHYLNQAMTAVRNCLAGAEAAAKVGNYRAEMVARSIAACISLEIGETDRAAAQHRLSLEVGERLGERQWSPYNLLGMAKIESVLGRHAVAVTTIEECLEICRNTGLKLWGPWVLGVLALVTDDADRREQALREGEVIIQSGCVGHCCLWFYRHAMEASLQQADWDQADRFAAALEIYTKPEPLPWSDLFIARGRALAAFGRGERHDAVFDALNLVRDEAARVGLEIALPALDAALEVTASGA